MWYRYAALDRGVWCRLNLESLEPKPTDATHSNAAQDLVRTATPARTATSRMKPGAAFLSLPILPSTV